jgi:hypothetical protein
LTVRAVEFESAAEVALELGCAVSTVNTGTTTK